MTTPAAIPLFDPAGTLRDVSPADVRAAIAQGWQQATPEQVAAYEREQKFGTPGQQAITFAEGVGKGVLGPVIPAVEQAFGVPAEDIRARAEENPIWSGAGVGVGIVGSLAGPAALKPFTLAGQAAKVGGAAKAAVEGAELAGLAGRALPAAAGMAAETAVFGASDVAERAVLRDPNLTAEQALATVGVSGLFGGILGGGGVLAKDAFSAGFSKAYSAAQRAYVKAVTPPGVTAEVAAGAGGAAAPAAAAGGQREIATFMLQHKQEIAGFEKLVPGAAKEMSQAKSPEVAAWMLKNADAIADFEKSFPGITTAFARADVPTAERLLAQRGKLITDPLERIKFADTQGKVIQQSYDMVDEALGNAFRSARPAEVKSLGALVPQETADAQVVAVRDRLKAAIDEIGGDPAMYEQNYAANLKKLVKRLDEVSPSVEVTYDALGNKVEKFVGGSEPAEIFKALNETKQRLADYINFDKQPSQKVADTINVFKGTYADMRRLLENEEVWGQLGARQRDFNKAASEFFDAKKALEKRLMEGAVGDKEMSVTKVNAWLNAMADPRGAKKTEVFTNYAEAGKRLADQMEKSGLEGAGKIRSELERLQRITGDIEERAEVTQVVKMLQGHEILSSGPAIPMERDVARAVLHTMPGGSVISTVEGVIKSVTSVPAAVGVLSAVERMAAKTSAAVEKGISVIFAPLGTAGVAAEAGHVVKPSDFQKVAEAVRGTAADLEGTATKVASATSGMADHAPETTATVHTRAAGGISHLAEKLPTRDSHSPMDPPHQPSRAELAAFSRRLDIADNPTRVLTHIAAGTLTPEHLETLSAIYPSLRDDMRAQLMERVAAEIAGGRPIPYRTKLGLSMFLGSDLDSTTKSSAIAANQKAHASIQAQQQANEAAQNAAMSKLTLAARTATPAQSAANRRA